MRWVCVGPISNTAHALPTEPFTPLGINIIVSIIKKTCQSRKHSFGGALLSIRPWSLCSPRDRQRSSAAKRNICSYSSKQRNVERHQEQVSENSWNQINDHTKNSYPLPRCDTRRWHQRHSVCHVESYKHKAATRYLIRYLTRNDWNPYWVTWVCVRNHNLLSFWLVGCCFLCVCVLISKHFHLFAQFVDKAMF